MNADAPGGALSLLVTPRGYFLIWEPPATRAPPPAPTTRLSFALSLTPPSRALSLSLRDPRNRLVQAGHEVILQVEGDERCAQVLRTQFPRARLARDVRSLRELPAETDILAAALPWPESDDDDLKERPNAREHPWLPASRATAVEEHAHVFRLLAGRAVPWVLLELPVSLLRWATAAVPGRGDEYTVTNESFQTPHFIFYGPTPRRAPSLPSSTGVPGPNRRLPTARFLLLNP